MKLTKLSQSINDRKFLVAEVYFLCSGNDVAETATDCMDEELIERHNGSGNEEAAEKLKALAMEKACRWYIKTGRYFVALLQLSTIDNRFKQPLKRL